MTTLHLHLDIQDQDLQKALQEALEGEIVKLTRESRGEIVKLTRESLGEIIQDEVSQKLRGALTNTIPSLVRDQINYQVRDAVKKLLETTLADESWLKTEFKEMVRESIVFVVDKHLRKSL